MGYSKLIAHGSNCTPSRSGLQCPSTISHNSSPAGIQNGLGNSSGWGSIGWVQRGRYRQGWSSIGLFRESCQAQDILDRGLAIQLMSMIRSVMCCAEFGTKLTLTPEQIASTEPGFRPSWAHSACVYDHYTREKELRDAKKHNSDRNTVKAVLLPTETQHGPLERSLLLLIVRYGADESIDIEIEIVIRSPYFIWIPNAAESISISISKPSNHESGYREGRHTSNSRNLSRGQ